MRKLLFALCATAAISVVAAGVASSPHAATTAASNPITIVRLGTGSFVGSAPAASITIDPASEIDVASAGDTDTGGGDGADAGTNRTILGAVGRHGQPVSPSARAKSNPELGTNWQGLNFHDQRFANGGNQFSVEPPDQALCAGNGFVVEAVNDVAQVYDTAGHALLNNGHAVDLNTFYGYPAAINRATGQDGPELTDPVCLYDTSVNRFFLVVLTLDRVGTTSALAGPTHLDIAVSDSSDPTGTWSIYKLDTTDNGQNGTPDDGCSRGFCLGDYPHIGNDANGIYLTTNEFSTLGPGFYGSQIYALSKLGLVSGHPSGVHFNTLGIGPDGGGFTVWPAQSSDSDYPGANGGSEYFLSSRAVFTDDGTSDSILQWTMSNTKSLDTPSPNPALSVTTIPVQEYAVPPLATQPAGDLPLHDCVSDPTCAPLVGASRVNGTTFPGLAANDSRMQQVAYANGKLWGSLDTDVSIGGQDRAGIAYYVINPSSSNMVVQGQLGEAGTDYTYPSIGVLANGRGVMTFTLTGDHDYPSAAYTGIDAKVGAGAVHVAAAGAGPEDGFSMYRRAFNSPGPRWGDYGAAAVMGSSIWVSSEYIAQTCNYATYRADMTCGGTRGPLGNWATHISQLNP